jgi:hypothetical protein
MAIGILPSGVIAQELARTVTHSRADPWNWVTAYVVTRDPSDGSGPDRSCLDDIRKLLHPLIVHVIP